MKIVLLPSYVLLVLTFGTLPVHAQSRVVSSDSVPVLSGSSQVRESEDSIPNSISTEMRRWESILGRSYPAQFQGKQKAGDVLAELRRIGLPILLHQSARDDSLPHDEIIELKLPDSSLYTRLHHALEEFNACLAFSAGRILVISLDDADNPENLISITYDVSGMGISPLQMTDVIQNSIGIDSWEDTGTGLGTIVYMPVRGQDMLVIGQTYEIHLAIRKLLNDFNRMTGARPVRNHRRGTLRSSVSNQNSANSGSSSAVALPPGDGSQPSAGNRGGAQRRRSLGIGGSRGGGVFSIPD